MKKIKITFLILIILINSILFTGCWNYREIDQVLIVAGLAVDKGINDQYKFTVEIAQISGGKDSKTTSKTITAEGETMFDAARNLISLSGKRLYWSHAKVIILSRKVAEEGVEKVIDWYTRDSETRENVFLLVSEEATAKEIFDVESTTEGIKSFILGEMIKNQVSLSKAPITDILQYGIESKTKEISTIIPAVSLKKMNDKMVAQVMGSAIIKNNKLAGFLNGDETKDLNFIRNQVKGGVLTEEMQTDNGPALASLEIFKSNTKVVPAADGNKIKIDLNIETTVAIDEIEGVENLISEEQQLKLEKSTENTLKKQIQELIRKVQSEYGADIFGFGEKLREDKASQWKRVSNNWEDVFKDLKVNVETKVHIKNSAVLS
ncbi:Ger(x)C family spore germination protein [Caproiciproducens faecalis]|uniref:Ger(X)C family spore germination protein n=1 Tax=Caproiciproducens faecalis TaxID=2820301 RepID=A0ABS7DKU3_9FIRM|nr:Ger(x)C family spore germination protein [Caproiciproducens faecalis]MBW7571915.1 Ger(x)C family spore germination protein [Caproiciproducens faecalis]